MSEKIRAVWSEERQRWQVRGIQPVMNFHSRKDAETYARAARKGWKEHQKRERDCVGVHTHGPAPVRDRDTKKDHHRSSSAPSFRKQKQISRKIRLLIREGYEPKQAAAIAYRMYGVARPKAKRRSTRDPASERGNYTILTMNTRTGKESFSGVYPSYQAAASAAAERAERSKSHIHLQVWGPPGALGPEIEGRSSSVDQKRKKRFSI